jgi:cytochrome P450
LGEERVDEPPAFTNAQEEQQLWAELRDLGASLNRVLNETLRIHGSPVWRIFQVKRSCLFL